MSRAGRSPFRRGADVPSPDRGRPPPVRHGRRARRDPHRLRAGASDESFLAAGQPPQPVRPGSPVAIIATGMVLVIVTRNIDLSVGSIVGVVSMTDRDPVLQRSSRPRSASTRRSAGSSRSPSGVGVGRPHRRLPRLPDRLRRDPVVHRDAGRAARLARRGLGHRGRLDDRPGRQVLRRRCSPAGPEGSIGGTGQLDRRPASGRRLVVRAVQQPAPAAPVRLPAAPDVGRGRARRRRRRRGPRLRARSRTPTSGRTGSSAEARRKTRRSSCHRAAIESRHPRADPRRHRRDARRDVHRPATAVRPRGLRARREPGRGRAGRHQHPLDRHEDVHPRWSPVRPSPARSRRPA